MTDGSLISTSRTVMPVSKVLGILGIIVSIACGGALKAQAQGLLVNDKPLKSWLLLRVPLDSGEVRVEVNPGAATVRVVASTGTFDLYFSSMEPLEDWADAAQALSASAVEPTNESTGAAILRSTGIIRARTEYRLQRAGGDSSSSGYLLTGTNGAWNFALKLSHAQSTALFGALNGDSTMGALTYKPPRGGRPRDEYKPEDSKPDISGAWSAIQVDKLVQMGARPPQLSYPVGLEHTEERATVRLRFIVDSTGRVLPSSITLFLSPQPRLATRARDAVLNARYQPAERDGRKVAQITFQDFEFGRP